MSLCCGKSKLEQHLNSSETFFSEYLKRSSCRSFNIFVVFALGVRSFSGVTFNFVFVCLSCLCNHFWYFSVFFYSFLIFSSKFFTCSINFLLSLTHLDLYHSVTLHPLLLLPETNGDGSGVEGGISTCLASSSTNFFFFLHAFCLCLHFFFSFLCSLSDSSFTFFLSAFL